MGMVAGHERLGHGIRHTHRQCSLTRRNLKMRATNTMIRTSTPSHHTYQLSHLPPSYTYYSHPPIPRAGIITPLSKALKDISLFLHFLHQLTKAVTTMIHTSISPLTPKPTPKLKGKDNRRQKLITQATRITNQNQ